MGDMSREPSMEEILSSIRRVIARDDGLMRGGDKTPGDPASGDSNAAATVTDSQQTRTAFPILAPGLRNLEIAADADDTDDVLELTNGAPAPDAVPSMATQPQSGAAEDGQLVSQVSAAASRQSLEALALALNRGNEPVTAAPSGADVTLHQLAEAALKPMLKAWLDSNLPPMVERIVAREIARITGDRF